VDGSIVPAGAVPEPGAGYPLRDRTWVIANPAAGRGTTVKALAELRTEFVGRGVTEFHPTTVAGDEEVLSARAIDSGAQTIVAVGGDGTCTRVAQAILASGKPCRLAVIPTGTGNDFAKTLGVAKLPARAIADLVARDDTTSSIDVGISNGQYFLNSCGFGFDASVLEATTRNRFLKGDAVYIYSALRQLFTYRGMSVAVGSGDDADARKMLMLTVSNGQFLGGAFRIAPTASVVDGELDVAFISDSNVIQRARLFAGALRGTHIRLPSVKTQRVKAMTLRFDEEPMMEIDGELRQARSPTVEIECQARALNVVAAPGAPH
jgi:diacylglycerol kinase (ATP)